MTRRLTHIASFLGLLAFAASSPGCTAADDSVNDRALPDVAYAPGQMTAVASFGNNPGALGMFKYVPDGLAAGSPLVVVMHGCVQGAMDMVHAGWNDLADEYGFAVVYPEQTTDNNPVRCFNWAGEYGDPANMTRGQGENASVLSMVDHMIAEHQLDDNQVFISGFSAGAAFAAVMLATYPDRFSAGAILSGVPYRCADTVDTAYDCQQMNQNPTRKQSPEQWGALVRDAFPGFSGTYPRVSIWHGLNDTFIVHHENMIELVEQWTNVHGIDTTPSSTETVADHEHASYSAGNRVVVETYAIAGMGHAVSFDTSAPDHPCGPATFAQYYEDRGICSTFRIAEFFGVTGNAPTCDGDDCCEGDDCNTGPDTGPPTVEITSPGDGDTVTGTVGVTASASDDTAIDRVEFYVDGALQVTDRSAPYSFDWPTAAFGDGDHDLMAIAHDGAGNLAVDDNVTVTVDGSGNGAAGGGLSGCSATRSAPPVGFALVLLGWLALSTRRRRSRG